MPKFFTSEEDKYKCSYSMSENIWFIKNQSILLGIANTKFGRDLLCIPQEYPQIVLLNKNCVHCFIGNDGTTTTLLADFRIGAKFANIIRYRWKEFNSYAKYFQLKGWQEVGKSPFILGDRVCALTLTAYPDPNVETTTFDSGWLAYGSPWSSIRGAATAQQLPDDDVSMLSTSNIAAGTTYIWRAGALFNTSSLTAAATITAATVDLYAKAKVNAVNDAYDYTVICSLTTSSNTAATNTDYANFGTTALSNTIDITGVSTSTYQTFTINDLTTISKTGITKYGCREGHDMTNNSIGSGDDTITWAAADTLGTSNDTYLTVTYTIPSTYISLLLLGIG